jgi:hypothetical protein
MTRTRPTIQMSSTGGRLADRVEARLNELKAENARLRDFVGWVAAPARFKDGIGVASIRARELLNELEVTA